MCYAVQDVDKAFAFLKNQPDARFISDDPDYKPVRLDPFPLTFFYWLDPYGIQWECEEGDKIIVTQQINGMTRIFHHYIQYKS